MKFTVAAALASSAFTLVSAAPAPIIAKRADANITDTTILNYALTLENLENAFYAGALAKFDEDAFTKAGFPSWVRGRFSQIAAHEAQHVGLLAGALGSAAVKACNYSFPYTDPKSFAALSMILEGVGTSAYLGAAASISTPAYLTVAGSILTTEARHQAWVASAVEKGQPWSAPEDTPLDFNQVYSLASPFITSCPSSNPALPFMAFPILTGSPANAASGKSVTYDFTAPSGNSTLYAAYFYGLSVMTAPLDAGKKATIPKGMVGTYYTVITTSANGTVTDDNTVAGPLISIVGFPSSDM